MVLPSSLDTAKVLKPGKEALDFPTAAIASERALILSAIFSGAAMRSNHFDAGLGKLRIERVRVVSLIADETLQRFANEEFGKCLLHQRHFMRRSTLRANGDRKTMAVCDCHELGPLAPLGLADSRAPLFAGEKVPSINASRKSNPPRTRRSSARASTTPRMTPDLTHCWKRRWQV